jgi:hypothetical protein
MKIKLLFLLLLTFAIGNKVHAQQGFPFADEIRAFKHQDSINFPPKNGILFIGSSSIRLWSDLEQRFPGKPIIKRGVGGCELWQLVDYYTSYILFPYKPRKVFIYAGENDIAGGKNSQFVADEFQKLWEMTHLQLPGAQIYYMSIKPSPSRAKYFDDMTKANQLIKAYLANKPNSTYIDMGTVIFKDRSFIPDSSLFKADYLHLNDKGYDKWQKVLEPYVK